MRRRVCLVLALEGLLLLALGVGYGATTATSASGERGPAWVEAGFAVVVGALVLLLARAVDGERRWARSPAVTLNLVAVPVGVLSLQGGAWAVGVPVLLLAGAVLYLFATPELRAAFREA